MKSLGDRGPRSPASAGIAGKQGMQRWRSGVLALLVASTVAIWSSCSDEDKNPVFCGNGTPDPTIENVWPNDDATYWTYSVTVRIWDEEDGVPCDSLYQSEQGVPPVPTLDEIENLLKHPAVPDSFRIYKATYQQEFAGDTTSGSGVSGQNLRETLIRPGGSGMLQKARVPIDPLIARLYLARPDLRDAIEHHLGEDAKRVLLSAAGGTNLSGFGCFELECPLLIHGGTWKKTDDWIGTYGDIDTALAWKFIEADLSAGHEFTHQLIPLLAGDIFLHCRAVGLAQAATVKCIYREALDYIYVVDYGVYPVQGSYGQPKGYIRTFDYGRVLYVPGVGPVYSYERLLACTGTAVGLGYGDRTLSLIDTGTRSP